MERAQVCRAPAKLELMSVEPGRARVLQKLAIEPALGFWPIWALLSFLHIFALFFASLAYRPGPLSPSLRSFHLEAELEAHKRGKFCRKAF